MLRKSELFVRVRALKLTIRHTDGEYRIAHGLHAYEKLGYDYAQRVERNEAQAYYTDDTDDAYGTAIIMAKQGAS